MALLSGELQMPLLDLGWHSWVFLEVRMPPPSGRVHFLFSLSWAMIPGPVLSALDKVFCQLVQWL